MSCSGGPYNGSYSMRQSEKALFISVPLALNSFIMPTEPVKLTPCDIKKYTQKYLKLNPHK